MKSKGINSLKNIGGRFIGAGNWKYEQKVKAQKFKSLTPLTVKMCFCVSFVINMVGDRMPTVFGSEITYEIIGMCVPFFRSRLKIGSQIKF